MQSTLSTAAPGTLYLPEYLTLMYTLWSIDMEGRQVYVYQQGIEVNWCGL